MLLKSSPLFKACRKKDTTKAAQLIDSQPDMLGRETKEGKTLLHFALEDGSYEMCETLLKKAEMYNTMIDGRRFIDAAPTGFPVIKDAIYSNNMELVTLFLRYNPSLLLNYGWTALHFAVSTTFGIMKAILEVFPCEEIDALGPGQNTALQMAICANQLEQVALLLEAGADANKTGIDGKTALYDAVKSPSGLAMVKLLVKYGADVNKLDPTGSSVLQLSVSIAASGIVSYLLAKGANVDVVGTRWNKPAWQLGYFSAFFEYGYCDLNIDKPALHVHELQKLSELDMSFDCALQVSFDIDSQHIETFLLPGFQLMCSTGCEISISGLNDILIASCVLGLSNLVFGLMEARNNVLSILNNQELALVISLNGQHFTLFKSILEYFAWDINVKLGARIISFVHAVIANSIMEVDEKVASIAFLAGGMNFEIDSIDGERSTPLVMACKLLSDIKIFKVLIENGASARSQDNASVLPLHTLIDNCTRADEDRVCAIVSLLLDHGADSTAATDDEETALFLAAKNGLNKIVTLIERHNVCEKREFKRQMQELFSQAVADDNMPDMTSVALKLLEK